MWHIPWCIWCYLTTPHEQTDTCENIAFPKLSLRAVIKPNPLRFSCQTEEIMMQFLVINVEIWRTLINKKALVFMHQISNTITSLMHTCVLRASHFYLVYVAILPLNLLHQLKFTIEILMILRETLTYETGWYLKSNLISIQWGSKDKPLWYVIYRLTTAILIPIWVAMDCVTEYKEFYPQQPGKF